MKRRPAFYELNEEGDVKPLILSWETFSAPHLPEMKCQRLWLIMANWVERQQMNFGVLVSYDSPRWTWIQSLPIAQLLGTSFTKNVWFVSLRAMPHGSLGGTPIWLESGLWAAFLESHTPDHQRKVKEAPCRGGSQRWEDVEQRRTGKHRAQSFALSTPWWATPWLSRSDLPAASSVYACGLCKDHHFLWMHLKMLGSSAGFRWRCLWTQVKFQGSYVWKRLLAEKHPFPATSLSIWMLPPV